MNGQKKHQAVSKNPNFQGNLSDIGNQSQTENRLNTLFQGGD